MNDVDIELAETVRRIETRFAHRTVAFVEQHRDLISAAVVILAHFVIGHLVRAVILFSPIVMRQPLRVALRRNHPGRRTVAGVVVTR